MEYYSALEKEMFSYKKDASPYVDISLIRFIVLVHKKKINIKSFAWRFSSFQKHFPFFSLMCEYIWENIREGLEII